MPKFVIGLAACVWLSAAWVVARAAAPQVPAAGPRASVDYQQQVHPILAAKCLTCHSAQRRSGGLSLASYADVLEGGRNGAAVRPGDGTGSLLIQRMTGEVAPVMPLDLPALSGGEIAVIRAWISEGARETITSAAARPRWEAPLALTRPPVPDVIWSGWSTPVDRFVAAYLKEHGVSTGSAPGLADWVADKHGHTAHKTKHEWSMVIKEFYSVEDDGSEDSE